MVVTVLEDGVKHADDGRRVRCGKIRVVVGVEGWCGSVARGLTCVFGRMNIKKLKNEQTFFSFY